MKSADYVKRITEATAEFFEAIYAAKKAPIECWRVGNPSEDLKQIEAINGCAEQGLVELRGLRGMLLVQDSLNYTIRERYYVCAIERNGKTVDLDARMFSELTTDGPWHDLKFARSTRDRKNARNKQIEASPKIGILKGIVTVKYGVLGYDPTKGSLRLIEDTEAVS